MDQLAKLLTLFVLTSSGLPDTMLCLSSEHGAHVMPAFARCGNQGEHAPGPDAGNLSDGAPEHGCSETCPSGTCVDIPLPKAFATIQTAPGSLSLLGSALSVAVIHDGVLYRSVTSFTHTRCVRPEIPTVPDPLIQTCRMII